MNFKNALNQVINSMIMDNGKDTGMCCAVYWDDNCKDNAIVMFMEYEDYANMHEVMAELHKRLSAILGHPVSLCHNHPTDESVLIHGEPEMATVYYKDECCKEDNIRCCKHYLEKMEGYRPEIQALALGAKRVGELTDKTTEYVLETLDWNRDPNTQIIHLLRDYSE